MISVPITIVPITIRVKKEIVELAEKMVKYGIARSRSHAINLVIQYGLGKVIEEVKFWENLHKGVEELKRRKYRISRGGLSGLLSEERGKS